MVGVREPVRARAGRRQDRALLEREHDVGRAGGDERVGDRVGSLRIRDCVTTAVERVELAPSRAATAARKPAPWSSAVRISRCGSRGPLSEPAPSSAPRR